MAVTLVTGAPPASQCRSTAATMSAGSTRGDVGWRRTSVRYFACPGRDLAERVEHHDDGRRIVGRERRGPVDHVRTPGRGRLGDRGVVGRAGDAMRPAGERGGRGPRGPDGPADEGDAADRAQVLAGHPPAAAACGDEEQDGAVHDRASISNPDGPDRPARYPADHAVPAQPARNLGARERPRVVGPRAGDPGPGRPARRAGDARRDDRQLLRGRAGLDDGRRRHQRGDAPRRPVLLDDHDPPGARAHRRRLARAGRGAGLGGQRRPRRPVPRLRHDLPGPGRARRRALDRRRRGRRGLQRGQRRRRHPRADRDLAQPGDAEHVPPDPHPAAFESLAAVVPPADGDRDARRPRAHPDRDPRPARGGDGRHRRRRSRSTRPSRRSTCASPTRSRRAGSGRPCRSSSTATPTSITSTRTRWS